MLTAKNIAQITSDLPLNNFLGVFAADNLPSTLDFPACLIINTDPADRIGEHWVAVFLADSSRAEYFDSYGIAPFHEALQFCQYFCKETVYNKLWIQSPLASSCGHYCIHFLLHRSQGETFKNFLKRFRNFRWINNEELLFNCV